VHVSRAQRRLVTRTWMHFTRTLQLREPARHARRKCVEAERIELQRVIAHEVADH
jgi:hypothetical protein